MNESNLEKRISELLSAYESFLSCFELVFDNDWECTLFKIKSENYISENGTFIEPCIDDESNNWANRGGLLAEYRHLKSLIEQSSDWLLGLPTAGGGPSVTAGSGAAVNIGSGSATAGGDCSKCQLMQAHIRQITGRA